MSPQSNAERSAAWRRRQGIPERTEQPCGTVAAYRRHKRKDEPIDDACRQAWNEYHADRRASR